MNGNIRRFGHGLTGRPGDMMAGMGSGPERVPRNRKSGGVRA
uniref:Uncharacterized protein n=1 Tax=Candidatus Kentrum sp. FW TaxID=2126338 RepID=A0A450S6C8_9GAMM|nr:MAG: hypothetical protein BECKFW1821B_GA0114236_100263 [Candidatus Kentron sp. FW]